MTRRPIVISLFDYTGHAVRPWAEAGYTCYCYDLQHDADSVAVETVGEGAIYYQHADLSTDSEDWHDILQYMRWQQDRGAFVHFVFGFPPCTDLAGSGAKHWAKKAAIDPDFQVKAAAMAERVQWLGNMLSTAWCIENPVGALSRLFGKPSAIYDPYEFGGYLPEDDQHPRHPKYIAPRDAYTKKTCLWLGNTAVMPDKRPVKPEILEHITTAGRVLRGSRQFMKLGGSSLKTKNIRNETPRGWALAMFESNGKAPTS